MDEYKGLSWHRNCKEQCSTACPAPSKIELANNMFDDLKPEDDCRYFCGQYDNNGQLAIHYCNHPKNESDEEGNCHQSICPIVMEISL